MPVSLFSLDCFTEGWLKYSANGQVKYGNNTEEAFRVTSGNWGYENLMDYATEYFIDYNYSKF